MSSETASALSSLWFTYVLQSTAGYMLVWPLCRFVRDPQFRFRLRGVFLGAMVAAWLGLLLLSGRSAPVSSVSAALAGVSETPWSWTLNIALAPHFSTILSGLSWAYAAILAVFLLSFCARFWQLRTLLRASRPASESVSSLFDSVHSCIQAPRCELRLVQGLHSPAATGWWHPKIMLPDEFLSRLETPQLVSILRHELMHVRRRDYLWDRLATLGCYLVFFHPAAWLLRRHLRWDRELACDIGSVDRSDACRLEYAACLTNLASWRLSGRDFAGPIDFLSSPSLLGARVRALVSPPNLDYSATKKAALACLTAVSLTIVLRLVPGVMVTPFSPANAKPSDSASMSQEAPTRRQPSSTTERKQGFRRHNLRVPDTKVQRVHSRFASSPPQLPRNISDVSGPSQPQAEPKSTRRPAVWRVIPKVGGWAIRSVKLGFSKAGSHLGFGRHLNEPSGQLSSVTTKMGSG
jgi:beta-lactamase regulating signal transducer with metallopeptidase domain